MSAQCNLDLVRRMYEALNAQDLEAHHEFWHEDMIWHGPPGFGDVHGLDGFKYDVLRPFYAAFPDYHVQDDIQMASGDWVSATGLLTGHHRGAWLGLPPTGRAVRVRYSDFWLVRGGRLAENWVMFDNFSLLQQIGLDPLGGGPGR